jgi:D,D-heptose 1,7-bisphosphate phosphatase
MGYKIVIVTNQSGVARGILTEKTLARIHDKLKDMLGDKGASVDGIYYCPYLEDGVIQKYRKNSELRKPKPGMLLKAAEEMDIDLKSSWMVGDSERDVQAGNAAGCKSIFINAVPKDNKHLEKDAIPDYRAVNFQEAVNIIQKEQSFAAEKTEDTAGQISEKQETGRQTEEMPNEPAAQPIQEKQPKYKNIDSQIESSEYLRKIHEELKKRNREEVFTEFSVIRMLAGALQVIAGFCILLGLWFIMSPANSTGKAELSLWFAIALQLTALTLYMMQEKR